MSLVEVISQRLKEVMKEKKIGVFKLSKRSSVSISAIKNILNCKVKTVMATTTYKLALVLNMSLAEFFAGTEIFG